MLRVGGGAAGGGKILFCETRKFFDLCARNRKNDVDRKK